MEGREGAMERRKKWKGRKSSKSEKDKEKEGHQEACREPGHSCLKRGKPVTPGFHPLSCHIAWHGHPATRIKTFAPINHLGTIQLLLGILVSSYDFLATALKRPGPAIFIKIHQGRLLQVLNKDIASNGAHHKFGVFSAIKCPQNRPRACEEEPPGATFNLLTGTVT